MYTNYNLKRIPLEDAMLRKGLYHNYATSEDKLNQLYEAGVLTTDSNGNLRDKKFPEVVYDVALESTNKSCKGEIFYIIKAVRINDGQLIVTVLFPETGTIVNTTYPKIKSRNVYDPYYLGLFGGMCCYGNIDIDDSNRNIYELWLEIMGRCYNNANPLYNIFAENMICPKNIIWHCFEFFYEFFVENYGLGTVKADPNDIIWYCKRPRWTIEEIRSLYHAPFRKSIKPDLSLPERIRRLDIEERKHQVQIPKKKTGRPNKKERLEKLKSEIDNLHTYQLQLNDIIVAKQNLINVSINQCLIAYNRYKEISDLCSKFDENAARQNKADDLEFDNSKVMYDIINPYKYQLSEMISADKALARSFYLKEDLSPYINRLDEVTNRLQYLVEEYNKLIGEI